MQWSNLITGRFWKTQPVNTYAITVLETYEEPRDCQLELLLHQTGALHTTYLSKLEAKRGNTSSSTQKYTVRGTHRRVHPPSR